MRVMAMGDTGLLVEVDRPGVPDVPDVPDVLTVDAVLALHRALSTSDRPAGVLDVVPAAQTVLIRFDPAVTAATDVERWLDAATSVAPAAAPAAAAAAVAAHVADVTIEVRYDGDDLAEVARLTGLTPDGVVAAHTTTPWTVAFTGFAPGFGYLVGGDPRLVVPRLDVPRTRVPAGAVALAGPYSGVYPRASPGGWRLIGRTDASVWQLDRDPPALLQPGATVRFVAVW